MNCSITHHSHEDNDAERVVVLSLLAKQPITDTLAVKDTNKTRPPIPPLSSSPSSLTSVITISFPLRQIYILSVMTLLFFTPSSYLLPKFSAVRRHCIPPWKPLPTVNFQFLRPAGLLPPGLALRPHFVPCGIGATAGDLLHNAGATAGVLAGAYILVFAFDNLTQRKLIEQSLSRKLVHTLSGLLFLISWPFFSNSRESRYFAAFVPLVNCLRLLVNGLALTADEGLVKSITRKGDPKELLKGPLYYVLMLMLCALVFWRESPIGIVSLALMCGGDGVADIIGRRFGSVKIPYNPRKSWVGSISMLIFGFLISIGMLCYYSVLGYMQLDWSSTFQRVALVSLVATVVESLPITEVVDDNISVPLSTMAVGFLSFSR